MNELYIFLPLNFSALNFTSLPFSKSKSFLNDPNLISLKIAYKVCSSSNSVPNEISDEVFYSNKSKVWQQAENRVHVQKSILLFCLNKLN